jgi:hypothetical protein
MLANSILRKTYDYFIKHWVLSALISTAPAFIFTFTEFFGKDFGLIDQNGAFTHIAKIILWPSFVISLIFSFVMALADKRDEYAKQNGQIILSRIIQSLDEIKHKKLKRFIRYIDQNHNKANLSPFNDITQPISQLESILENFQYTLAEIFGIRHNDIGISLMYHTNKDRTWKWLYTTNIEGDLSLNEITENPISTAHDIITGQTSSIFYPSKKSAASQGKYVPSSKDHAHRMIGSIICRDISISTNEYVKAIFSVSTYGKQICLENDEDAIFKVEQVLLPSFERRIQLELALLYIKEALAA